MAELIEKDHESRHSVLSLSFQLSRLKNITELVEKYQESRHSVLSLSYQSSRLKHIT